MTLLEDIRAEREELLQEARKLRNEMTRQTHEGVKHTHEVRPVVGAIVGLERQVYLLDWHNVLERNELFADLNNQLDADNVSATVTITGGRWVPDFESDDADEIRNHPNARSAVMVTTLTPHWKELLVYPYEIHGGKVHWQEPKRIYDFEPMLVQVPKVN